MVMILGTAIMGFVFSSLTVEVDDFELRWWFAPKLYQHRIQRADIVSARPVSSRAWRGWGIRMIKGGWGYTVSGLSAVEVHLKNGRRVLIGTDRPEELARALMAA
jgi:hypothetical protein